MRNDVAREGETTWPQSHKNEKREKKKKGQKMWADCNRQSGHRSAHPHRPKNPFPSFPGTQTPLSSLITDRSFFLSLSFPFLFFFLSLFSSLSSPSFASHRITSHHGHCLGASRRAPAQLALPPIPRHPHPRSRRCNRRHPFMA